MTLLSLSPSSATATLASVLLLRASAQAGPFPERSSSESHLAHSLTSSKSLLKRQFSGMSTLSTLKLKPPPFALDLPSPSPEAL